MNDAWPDIPYAAWSETCELLHLCSQIIGKFRLAHTPWVNRSWHATLYVAPRGLTTGMIPTPVGPLTVDLDVIDPACIVRRGADETSGFPLTDMSVSEFDANLATAIKAHGLPFRIHASPNELPDPIPFTADERTRRSLYRTGRRGRDMGNPWQPHAVTDCPVAGADLQHHGGRQFRCRSDGESARQRNHRAKDRHADGPGLANRGA